MTTTEPRVDVITTAHKRALRHADDIIFRLRDGVATIEAVVRADRSPNGFEQIIAIRCDSRVADHGREYTYTPDNYVGFHMEGSYRYNRGVLRTVIDRISIGGTVTLDWTRNNNSDLTREAGLVVDMLHVTVHRANAKPNTLPDVYLVRVSVTKDNSARMVRIES